MAGSHYKAIGGFNEQFGPGHSAFELCAVYQTNKTLFMQIRDNNMHEFQDWVKMGRYPYKKGFAGTNPKCLLKGSMKQQFSMHAQLLIQSSSE